MRDASGFGFDRFAICEAVRCYCTAWHGGQWSALYAYGGRLVGMRYRPGVGAEDWPSKDSSGENDHTRALLAAWLWNAKPWRRKSDGMPSYWRREE